MTHYELIPTPEDPWNRVAAIVANSVFSEGSRRVYRRGLRQFRRWYEAAPHGPLSKALVQEYRAHLEHAGFAPSTISRELCIVRKLALEAADNGLLDPSVAAAIARVRGASRKGVRLGNWLTLEQLQRLLDAPDVGTLRGRRDQALLALLAGTGLRRSEAAALTTEHLQQRDGRPVLVDLLGKHHRVRSVALPAWAAASLALWLEAAGIRDGRLFRGIGKAGHLIQNGLSAQAIYGIVKSYASQLALHLAPHDLRRTHARLAKQAGALSEQIQLSLGHASIITTERYLGLQQNLAEAPGDHIAVHVKAG